MKDVLFADIREKRMNIHMATFRVLGLVIQAEQFESRDGVTDRYIV